MKTITDEQIANKRGIGWPILLLLLLPFTDWIGFFWLMSRMLRPRLSKIPYFMIGRKNRLGSVKCWGAILIVVAGLSFGVGVLLDSPQYDFWIVCAYIHSLLLLFSAIFLFKYDQLYAEYRDELQYVLNVLSPTVDPRRLVITVGGMDFKYDYWIEDLRQNNIPFLEYWGDKDWEASTSSHWHAEWSCSKCGAENAKDVAYGEKPVCDNCQEPVFQNSKKKMSAKKEKQKQPTKIQIVVNIDLRDED